MNFKQLFILGALTLSLSLSGQAPAQDAQRQYVQIAELEIDPAQLDSYKAAVQEQIEAAIRLEPGVQVLYAVSEKDNPAREGVRGVRQHGGIQRPPPGGALQKIQEDD
jgi:hypothetical protein